jgi:Ca-activated chloride channel family protein
MAIFSFSQPQYLVLLFGVPLLFLIHFFSLGNKKKKALRFANFDAISRIEGIDFFSKNVVMLVLNIFIIACLAFAASGLTFHTFMQSSSFSYVIAIDTSNSMEADDFSPNRMAVAQKTASDFVDNAPFDVDMAVISFSGSSVIEQDLTDRKLELKNAISGIKVREVGGTDVYEAILTSSNLLQYEEHKAAILLSDGQVNVGSVDDAIDYANRRGVIIHTIGMGTKEGGMTEYALSKLDEEALQSMAYHTGGVYASGENQKDLTTAFSNIFQLTERKVAINLSGYLLLFAILLFVLNFFLSNTKYINFP